MQGSFKMKALSDERSTKNKWMIDSTLRQACCARLASALRVNQRITDLDLRGSDLGDLAMILLCDGLMHPGSAVQKLDIARCLLTETCCANLAAVFQKSPSLKDVDMQCNHFGDLGVRQLCEGLRNPDCKIKKTVLKSCSFTDLSCSALASVLSAGASLRELSVGDNDFGDSGVQLLCEGLMAPGCRLQALWIQNCKLTASGCASLSSALCINTSLTELVVVDNVLGDSGMKHLCEGLKHPGCKIQTLGLSGCSLTSACCEDLASVFSTNQHLLELDLGSNALEDYGVIQLCTGLKSPNSRLRVLDLTDCSLTGSCFGEMASVFSTNTFLTELHFTQNNLKSSFMEQLFKGLKHESCKLQKLWLDSCALTDSCCGALSGILSASPSLTELYLGDNELGYSGLKQVLEGLKQPSCNIQTLSMGTIIDTDSFCEDLASAITTCQFLTDLDLSGTELGDSGVRLLCGGLKHPGCKVKELGLVACSLTDACCADLASVFGLSQSLSKLNVSWNKLGDSGVKELCATLKHPGCRLQTLLLDSCSLTASCCADLASVLSTSQHLQTLNLRYNQLGDSGVTLLCEGLKYPLCALQTLGLSSCTLTDRCCRDLAASLHTNSSLAKLRLGTNELGVSGVRDLCEALKHPDCRIRALGLEDLFRVEADSEE